MGSQRVEHNLVTKQQQTNFGAKSWTWRGDEDDPDCSSVDTNNNAAHPEEMRPRTEKITCDSGCVASLQPKPWADLTKEEVEKIEEGGDEAKGKAAEAKWKGVRTSALKTTKKKKQDSEIEPGGAQKGTEKEPELSRVKLTNATAPLMLINNFQKSLHIEKVILWHKS